MNEVVREFLLESDENLAQLDLDLLALEKDPNEKETIARVFRTLHTVKGTAGFLGLEKLQAVSHSAENLLSKVRSGALAFGPPIASALLAVLDAVREILRRIESDGTEGERDDSALIALLDALTRGEVFNEQLATPTQAIPETDPLLGATSSFPALPAENLSATIFLPEGADLQPESKVASTTPINVRTMVEPPPEVPILQSPNVVESAIRVNVGLLDNLMNVVGELVLTRNQILRHTAASEDPVLLGTVQRLNLLTTELQAGVMKTRMQPVGAVWSKFPRLVRDLAVACGKQVRFEMDGQDTELDKTILEAIRDPLTHMVRNAVDHGIESPEARIAAGKPPEGSLRLHAFHESGKVVMEVADDGGGIDPKRIRDKAVRMGMVTEEAARRLTERETLELIFRPGFSTSETVTQFSGRGVGMDVVRTNVERMGGTVDLESKLGVGASVRMRMPLTLAIIPALVVTSAGERFAIPQVSLLELIRIEGERADLEDVHGAPVYRLRGNLLPLAFLDRELGLNSERAATDGLLIVVLQADDRQFGLVVDSVHDTEEIVVKPLQPQIKGLNVYAGATIMGDGRVALILDVAGLAKRAGLTIGQSGRSRSMIGHSTIGLSEQLVRTLIFTPRSGGRMAMTLDQVARLEEFPRSAIERMGDRRVVQFRGSIMPLVDVAELLAGAASEGAQRFELDEDSFQVVVHEHSKGRVGLLVGRILDVIDEAVTTRTPPIRSGVLFNSVVGGFATEVLDVDEILRRAEHFLTPNGDRSVA